MSFSPIQILYPNTQKIGCVSCFFQSIEFGKKHFGLYNLNCISINFRHVCNMGSQFKDHINLANSHPSTVGHC